jgi:hypothetical protein
MALQIARTYNSIPDVDKMTLEKVEFFYDGLREELRQMTKPSD